MPGHRQMEAGRRLRGAAHRRRSARPQAANRAGRAEHALFLLRHAGRQPHRAGGIAPARVLYQGVCAPVCGAVRHQRLRYLRHRLPARPQEADRGRAHRLLHRPQGRRLRGARPARRRPVQGRGAAGERRGQARLSAHSVCGQRQALRARRPVRPRHQVHRLRKRHPQAQPSGRPGMGTAENQGQGGTQEAGLRPCRALCQTLPGNRLCLQPRQPLAAGVRGHVPLRADRGPAKERGADRGRHGKPAQHGPPALRRRGLRQDRGGPARGLQGRGGGQAGSHPGPDHDSGAAALQHHQKALRGLPREV